MTVGSGKVLHGMGWVGSMNFGLGSVLNFFGPLPTLSWLLQRSEIISPIHTTMLAKQLLSDCTKYLEQQLLDTYLASSWRVTREAARKWRASGRRAERRAERGCSCRRRRCVWAECRTWGRDTAPCSTSSTWRSWWPGGRQAPTRCSWRSRKCPPSWSWRRSWYPTGSRRLSTSRTSCCTPACTGHRPEKSESLSLNGRPGLRMAVRRRSGPVGAALVYRRSPALSATIAY